MTLNSRSAGIFWKAGLSLTGLLGYLTFASTPALAQAQIDSPIADFSSGDPGSFAGAIVYITPGAYLSTAAAQINPPIGTFFRGFNGSYTVTGASYIDPITHISTPSITLHTGGLFALPYTTPEGSIRGAIVERLRFGNLTLDEFSALVRAAVGNDGLD
ncbi:hypothetical protein IQ259_14305 [Fortiea sp. LEGE XX443]|uniref:hypothetical protein n=1 Tax=Fortiea sp. LEGE XX443 TaxID=1828611 RepID=UPI00187F4DE5|nr:hypothetical protein [Fortiea sp. LEGE XX443]MBE9006195.1 hypothetical protein [Fortiea sp. LEGE XX443]